MTNGLMNALRKVNDELRQPAKPDARAYCVRYPETPGGLVTCELAHDLESAREIAKGVRSRRRDLASGQDIRIEWRDSRRLIERW